MTEHNKPGQDDGTDNPAPANENGVSDPATDATLEALEAALAAESGAAADNARVAELESQVSDLTDRLLRTAADADNVRRRAEKEKEDTRKFALQKFADDMLAVADNLQRALQAIPEGARDNDAVKGIAEGVELTERELNAVLERHGVKPVEALGQKFDPNLHQAVFEVETGDAAPGTVVQVLREGYTLNDRLLRAAMVGVAKAKG